MDRYEVMTGKMMPLTDGAHRKWGFTGKVVTRSYERLVDTLIDFVETGIWHGWNTRQTVIRRSTVTWD